VISLALIEGVDSYLVNKCLIVFYVFLLCKLSVSVFFQFFLFE
jgi:hypothetical protein